MVARFTANELGQPGPHDEPVVPFTVAAIASAWMNRMLWMRAMGSALALPELVELARATGSERADA
jgi:hypothetical protein